MPDEIDNELLEVYAEEVLGGLDAAREQLVAYRHNKADTDALAALCRFFHSLRGGGQMVGATAIAELGTAMEDLLGKVMGGGMAPDEALCRLLHRALGQMPELVAQLQAGSADASESSRAICDEARQMGQYNQ